MGERIGNYVVSILIGKGGMGDVYLAHHPEIDRKVAVKVMNQRCSPHSDEARRFSAEAKAIALIDHPNVVAIYDFGQLENGRFYYVMEFLKGRELREVIKISGRMTPSETIPFLEQIASALQAAHDLGIVHRDLKPSNIVVLNRQPLTLKVLDFGLAKLMASIQEGTRTAEGIVLGTPMFMAPEQAIGRQDLISPRTDLYSLGIILYYMLAGQLPFPDADAALVRLMQIKDQPRPLSEVASWIPPRVAAVVERCLEKDPGKRPGSATELCSDFAEALLAGPPLPLSSTADQPPDLSLVKTRVHVSSPAPRWVNAVAEVTPDSPPPAALSESSAPASSARVSLLRRFPLARWLLLGALVALPAAAVALGWLLRPSPEVSDLPLADPGSDLLLPGGTGTRSLGLALPAHDAGLPRPSAIAIDAGGWLHPDRSPAPTDRAVTTAAAPDRGRRSPRRTGSRPPRRGPPAAASKKAAPRIGNGTLSPFPE